MDYDALEKIEESLFPAYDSTDPNSRYDSSHSIVYTINSEDDANSFCRIYNKERNYSGLSIGTSIKINDGSHNTTWYIAGFDCEYNHKASDGTIKDNGYGICLIPSTQLTNGQWDSSSTDPSPYMSSWIHSVIINHISTISKYKTVLGNHLINRNVLLCNSIDKETGSKSYTWTTSYFTLMSSYQLTGTNNSMTNIYDRGEANYQLPLFKFMSYYFDSYWLRGFVGKYSNYGHCCAEFCLHSGSDNRIWFADTTISSYKVYPLIYIR